jgi:hypothetical protein
MKFCRDIPHFGSQKYVILGETIILVVLTDGTQYNMKTRRFERKMSQFIYMPSSKQQLFSNNNNR